MPSKKVREYECNVVHERVHIHLKMKRTGWTAESQGFFVQCDQEECQHVNDNRPPCALDLSMFSEEIAQQEENKRKRRNSDSED